MGKLNLINYTRIMELVTFTTCYLVMMDLSIKSFDCVFIQLVYLKSLLMIYDILAKFGSLIY